MKKEYLLYVLVSEKSGRLYVGQTQNLVKQLEQHNKGRCRSTRSDQPWRICYQERHRSRSKAVVRERYFKNGSGRKKLAKILGLLQ